jgi:predicted  nucleic acid-binding Zn-ribbon protein
MPHKCTRCESIFKDGVAIILNGCPNCGWNKFLYVRDEKTVSRGETTKEKGMISQEASKFIKEVDELIGKRNDPVQPEIRELKEKPRSEEIGDRVESVKILSPGQYELNLESILKRDEIVMALKEDGTYFVHLPSVFQKKKHQER